ncbi:SDR family NAD(P)-dependent oxidoreductase [Parasphingorhabdus sp.]|uniref:SDR family NAD(P)-dependent oxidoreductase n=1 Tax=Parasphingorhabdus sp. TaxID=2709688 RepID=UPI003A8E2B96
MIDQRRHGPWAIIAGASEGTGKAFAKALARAGIASILIARRQKPLADLAAEIAEETGIECVCAAIDLYAPDAADRVIEAAGDREIGLFIVNAGGDPEGQHFLDLPVENWIDQVNRGVLAPLQCCHHFGTQMAARGQGGILFVGSGACWGGAANMAAYSGIKSFMLNFAEGLWAELQPKGVDVLYAALGTTDTPELRRFMAAKNLPLPDDLADPEAVALRLFDEIGNGPVLIWGQADDEAGHLPMSAAGRRTRTLAIGQATKRIFGK